MVALVQLHGPNRRVYRRTIYDRENGHCIYCGAHLRYQEMTLDHVIPRSYFGQHTYSNLVCACLRCNQHKSDDQVWSWWRSRPFWNEAVATGRVEHLRRVMTG